MESGLGQSNSRCATCSKQCLPFTTVHALRRLRPTSRMIDSSLDGWYISSHFSLFSPVAPTRSSFSQATLRYLIAYPLDRTKLPRLSSFVRSTSQVWSIGCDEDGLLVMCSREPFFHGVFQYFSDNLLPSGGAPRLLVRNATVLVPHPRLRLRPRGGDSETRLERCSHSAPPRRRVLPYPRYVE